MSGFSAQWLSLREPVDLRARNAEVLIRVAAYCAKHTAPRITDLASGTGSTLRALRPHLPKDQRWRLTDHDKALNERAYDLTQSEHLETPVEVLQCDLADGIKPVLGANIDLLTTSAFLDLVSADWLDALVDTVAAQKIPFYAALSYDGRIACTPAHPLDGLVNEAVNRHQQGDKGFGPALGPNAALHAIKRFEAAGYTVAHGTSDWDPTPGEQAFQHQLVVGWAQAAKEIGMAPGADIDAWLTTRQDWIDAGVSRITVSHLDFFAHPTR